IDAQLAVLVDAGGANLHDPLVGPDFGHLDAQLDLIAEVKRRDESEILRRIHGSRPRKLVSQDFRKHRPGDHAISNGGLVPRGARCRLVVMDRVAVADHRPECIHRRPVDRPFADCAIPDLENGHFFISRAGTPATRALSATDFVTTAPAATVAFLPTTTPGSRVAPAPTTEPSSSFGPTTRELS